MRKGFIHPVEGNLVAPVGGGSERRSALSKGFAIFDATVEKQKTVNGLPYMKFVGIVHKECRRTLLPNGAAHCEDHNVDSLPGQPLPSYP